MDALAQTPMKLELPSKTVQELITKIGVDDEEIPERYICQNSDDNEVSQVPYMDTNIIDFELLSSASDGQNELQKLRSILGSWGCFQLTNHGLSSLMDQVREVAKHFFALPLEEKKKYSRTFDAMQGYGNDVASEAIPINWHDRLHLHVNPVDHRNLKFWPENVPNFRETLEEYTKEINKLQDTILRAIAKSLHLKETIFVKKFGGINMFARFNYYPPCRYPDRVIGAIRHSDASVITILLQDKEVEGLQVLKDEKWFKAPIIPDALFVNVGDQLEIISNGALKSAEHKVVVNSDRDRLSLAMFCAAVLDEELGPLSELIDDERPPLYRNVNDYRSLYFENLAIGVRPINVVKI